MDQRPVPEKDPIVNSSLALPIAISSLILILTLIWALYQESWDLRPWIGYQQDFVELYSNVLEDLKPLRAQEEQEVYSSREYQDLVQELEEAEAEAQPELAEIEAEERALRQRLEAVTKPFTTARSRLQATIYLVETTSGSTREAHERELEQLREGPYEVEIPDGLYGSTTVETFTYGELEEEFNGLKDRQGELQSATIELLRRPTALRQERDAYVNARLTGPTEQQVEALIESLDTFEIEIKQIHNPDMNLVDRCESCHLGIRRPVKLTASSMGGQSVFVSHPEKKLLEIHDPETFGCSPCHNGNGVATVGKTQAHGLYKHWLWPLYDPENVEAGCLQCHEADRRLGLSPTLDAGKQLFYEKGCWGCHPREGFEPAPRLLKEVQRRILDLRALKVETGLEIERTNNRADQARSDEEFERLLAETENLTLKIAEMDAEESRLTDRVSELYMEEKRVGPDLKEVRVKLNRDWIPQWIRNPHEFRPTTKMPRFRLTEDQVRAIGAFIWQSGLRADLEEHPPGDATRGQRLFETRGCMACHSMGEGTEAVGGTFAANLSRVGEKDNYNYLVRWIHNPRERTLPYCPVHQRDITPEDYAAQGLPFQFDLEHNECPLGDHLLQVQQPTVMPNLRLTWGEARDIASYLMTMKRDDVEYPAADYLDDPQYFEEGKMLASHFGCKGCHEITGLEEEGKIGTDLTKEGSKPIERLDFGLLTKTAKEEGWYNHKGFFERKLENPAVWDQGKEETKGPLELLRMPKPNIDREGITQLTTFLLGSVESRWPETSFDRPGDDRAEIKKGWWIIAKYNCMACHQIDAGQTTVLEKLPLYQDPDWRAQLPPMLVGEGARVDPNWLAGFLKNPALSDTELNRNGVRPYLEARMPTFNLSDGEIQQLVRFFSALSKQPLPYTPKEFAPLSRRELTMARDLFTHQAAPCLSCHATGDPATDPDATAPNFVLVPERLKPAWTQRWMVHPEIIQPGTAMPSGLFRWDGERWVFALANIPSFRGYEGDHSELLVRYQFLYNEQEQRQLRRR